MKRIVFALIVSSIIFPAMFMTNSRTGVTREGGEVRLMTNRTGTNTIYGQLVTVSTNYASCFMLGRDDGFLTMGAVYTPGVTNGGMAWVVIAGICDALMESNTVCTQGNWVYATSNGRANGSLR